MDGMEGDLHTGQVHFHLLQVAQMEHPGTIIQSGTAQAEGRLVTSRRRAVVHYSPLVILGGGRGARCDHRTNRRACGSGSGHIDEGSIFLI